jgi:colanic acid/amylovoran biosynthesis glycosyltransferase
VAFRASLPPHRQKRPANFAARLRSISEAASPRTVDDRRQELEKLAGEMELADAVQFAGFLSQPQLASLYARAHLFLHPSEMTADQNQEGVPNSMLEAMATGLPVLATLHGGIPEAVSHGKTGLLVAEKDHEALFQAMISLSDSPERFMAFGRAAAESVREEFSQSRAIDKLEDCYDELREIQRSTGREEIRPAP